jgi:monoamine oxidase
MRVIVVGAGLAGLTTATDLQAAGADPIVLEARDRVGGRVHGIEVAPGSWADAGAAYLGDRHTELHALLSAAGLKPTPTTMVGSSRFALDGRADTRPGRFPPLHAVALGELFDLLDELTGQVRADAPWLTPEAERWDTLTAEQWARQQLRHPDARLFFPLFLGELLAADPAAVSLLHLAFYLRSGGGISYLNAFEGGAQQDRVDGGRTSSLSGWPPGWRGGSGTASRCMRSTSTGTGPPCMRRAGRTGGTRWWWRCRRCWRTRWSTGRTCRCAGPERAPAAAAR